MPAIDPQTGEKVPTAQELAAIQNAWMTMQTPARAPASSPGVVKQDDYEQLLARINQRGMESLANQQAGIDEQAKQINELTKPQEQKTNFSALTGLTDAWTGSKFSQAYQAPETEKDRKALKLRLEAALQKSKNDLSENELNLLKTQLNAKLARGSGGLSSADLLPGQIAADREFGKEYQDWNAQGGYAGVEKQLNNLQEAANALEKDGDLSGGLSTMLPDSIRRRVSPESVAVEQKVRQAVMGSLRATLGSQFTEEEGERIFRTSYDPALPAAENKAKILATMQELKTRAQQKQGASEFFEQNQGSLRGYTPAQKRASEGQTKEYQGKTYRLQGDTWVRIK